MNDKGIKFNKVGNDVELLARFLTELELVGAAYKVDDHGDFWKIYITGG